MIVTCPLEEIKARSITNEVKVLDSESGNLDLALGLSLNQLCDSALPVEYINSV